MGGGLDVTKSNTDHPTLGIELRQRNRSTELETRPIVEGKRIHRLFTAIDPACSRRQIHSFSPNDLGRFFDAALRLEKRPSRVGLLA